jgi:hypothetical protein
VSSLDRDATGARLRELEAALRWALSQVSPPTYRTKANAKYCDEYAAACKALEGGGA